LGTAAPNCEFDLFCNVFVGVAVDLDRESGVSKRCTLRNCQPESSSHFFDPTHFRCLKPIDAASPTEWRVFAPKSPKCPGKQQGSLPTVHMPSKATRQWRSMIAYRHKLVSRRTAIKNSMRSILDQQGIPCPSGRASWTQSTLIKLKRFLIDPENATLEELGRVQIRFEHESLLQLERLVKEVEKKLNELARADQRVRRLRTIPRVGPPLAEIVVAIIDNPHRFAKSTILQTEEPNTDPKLGCHRVLT